MASLIAEWGFGSSTDELHKATWWMATAKALGISPRRLSPFIYATSSKATEIILTAHRKAVEAVKSVSGNFPVGITLALQDIQASEGGETRAARMRKASTIFI